MDDLTGTLALLRPEDLFPVWSCVDLMEELGEISPGEALRWKHRPRQADWTTRPRKRMTWSQFLKVRWNVLAAADDASDAELSSHTPSFLDRFRR